MTKLVLGGGCFWGLEELFRDLPGVTDTEVGYAGGQNQNPTYQNHPGHAEVIKVSYDESQISLKQILDFFTIHDPTTKDRQGNDVGSSYRPVIFYESKEERLEAEAMVETVNQSSEWSKPVVTTIERLDEFHPAEPEHHDYLQQNPGGYTCHYQRLESYLT